MTSLGKESKLLAKHSTIYGLGTLLRNIAAFLLLPVYTRFLTPHDYGIKELVGLSTDVIGILLATAISSAIYRFYFEYEDTRDRNEVISSAIITIGSFGILALFLLSFTTTLMAEYILDSPALYYFFLISFASLWFQSLNGIGYNYLRAEQQSVKYTALSFGKLLLEISLNIYLICFVKLGVLGVLISSLIASMAMSSVLMVPLIYRTGLHFSILKIKEMVRYGLPLIPSQFGAFIVHLSDRFFIKAYCSIADAGLYSLGYRFGTLPNNFISSPFNQTWLPRRFELYKQEGSEIMFGRIFTYFLYLMIFAGLMVSILTKDILRLIADQQFWSAYKIVPIIVLATIVFCLHYHFNIGILIHKKTKYLAYINFSNGIFVLILNFLLIPTYGVYGAAFATLIAFIYKVSLTYFISARFYKIHFEFLRIGKILFAAALVYMIILPIHFDRALVSLIVKSGIIVLFPFVLLIFNFYTADEKKKVEDFIRRKYRSLVRQVLKADQ